MKHPITILSPPLKDFYFPVEWYQWAGPEHFWFVWRFRALLQQIQSLRIDRAAPFKGFEIGCGNGLVRQQIEQQTAWSVDGTDLLEEPLHLNHSLRGETFLYNIHDRRTNFKEVYDFIILFDVLEHIDDTQLFWESVLYHLKAGGWIFINVPALQPLYSSYDVAAGHFRRYNLEMMRQELRQAHLVVRDMRYWGLSLVPLLFIRKLLLWKEPATPGVIEKGFKVPRKFINAWFLRLMHIETALVKKPIRGISLMTVAMKR